MNNIPLAERLRPVNLDQIIGQEQLTGKDSILRTAIENKNIPSIILWGPPGVGKTSIANIIAQNVDVPYFQLSAISAGVKDIREVIEKAKAAGKAILFIDEIHKYTDWSREIKNIYDSFPTL